jgi:UDP-N-acetylmuramate--alanine ligase
MTESRTVTLPTGDPATVPNLARPHFVGIGGISMRGLAQICAARGARVTGSDTDPARLAELADVVATVREGHGAPPPADATAVIYSTAVADDNPELEAARAMGLPVVHRAQALAALAAGRTSVFVAGTHGKSSTTAMLATVFTRLGFEPSYAIGAALAETGDGARHGDGAVIIAEADESDRSFLFLRPDMAVVTNIGDDHPENYTGLTSHIDAYEQFAAGVRGTLVVNIDDPGAAKLAGRLCATCPDTGIVTYGEAPGADWRITGLSAAGMSSRAEVTAPNGQQLTIELPAPGRHMAHNAVAALAAAVEAGADASRAAHALGSYPGISGRLTSRGRSAGVQVLDSYAHHPAEIRADLLAARTIAGDEGQVIAVYQPRGYARVKAYAAEMGQELKAADTALILPVYASVGQPIPGVNSDLIAAAGTGEVTSPAAAVRLVAETAGPGDVVLIMGSGPLAALGEQVCAALATNQATNQAAALAS